MKMTPHEYEALLPYATETQAKYVRALVANRTYKATAKACGVNESSVTIALKALRLSAARVDVEPHLGTTAAEGFEIKGVSSYHKATEEKPAFWLKTSKDAAQQAQAIKVAIEAMMQDVPKARKIDPPKLTIENLASLYIITDYHIGMLAWAEETGAAWDTQIAEDMLFSWFEKAASLAPDSEVGIFGQLGDFLHFDGLDAVTPTNRHVLDADTRFDKLVRVAIRVTRRVINLLLTKHAKVHVIMAEGNHDLASSAWLRSIFYESYQDNPRVTVDRSPKPYYAFEWGITSLFFHHGHKKNFGVLDQAFTGMFPEIFGRTKFRYGHSGHLHHSQVKESGLMVMEQHRTLAAPDAHAARGAWISERSADVITYSKTCGQISRQTIPYKMLIDG
jgi:hypothetical protein